MSDSASHLTSAFRQNFHDWFAFRSFLADTANHPTFNLDRAVHQVLMADFGSRLIASSPHDWLLLGSLSLPGRTLDSSLWSPGFQPEESIGIAPNYTMPRSAFDLDLCALDITDPDPRIAASRYGTEVEAAVRTVAAPRGYDRTDTGIGLGGLVHYSVGELSVYPNGQVMGVVTAQPINAAGSRRVIPVDDPIGVEIDIKPPSKILLNGPPLPSARPVVAFDVPGMTPFAPPLYPSETQFADKAVLLTGAPVSLRNPPQGPWHRYKDLIDLYFMTQTCSMDAGVMRQALATNWNLARMSVDRIARPYRIYGQDADGTEPVVPWDAEIKKMKSNHAQLRAYPDWEQIKTAVASFVEGVYDAPEGSAWAPGRGWVTPRLSTLPFGEPSTPFLGNPTNRPQQNPATRRPDPGRDRPSPGFER